MAGLSLLGVSIILRLWNFASAPSDLRYAGSQPPTVTLPQRWLTIYSILAGSVIPYRLAMMALKFLVP